MTLQLFFTALRCPAPTIAVVAGIHRDSLGLHWQVITSDGYILNVQRIRNMTAWQAAQAAQRRQQQQLLQLVQQQQQQQPGGLFAGGKRGSLAKCKAHNT